MSTWGPTNISADADDVHLLNPGGSEALAVTLDNHNAGRIAAKTTNTYDLGLRWAAVGIPQGATISDAKITIEVATYTGTPNVDIYADDVDDAAEWSLPDEAPNDITKTTACILGYDPGATGSIEIDVTDELQEVISRPGFASGHAVRFAFQNQDGDGNNWFNVESVTKSGGTPATLEATYTGGVYNMPQVWAHSAYPVTNPRVFPNFHVGDGGTSDEEEGMGVQASLGADAIWRLRFLMPETLPGGTCKLKLWALADAVENAAKVNVKWGSVAPEEDPSSATMNAEGTSTVTWAAADDDVYKELKVTLDADTIVAGEMVVMDLTFEASGWTLAVVSTWQAWIIWE